MATRSSTQSVYRGVTERRDERGDRVLHGGPGSTPCAASEAPIANAPVPAIRDTRARDYGTRVRGQEAGDVVSADGDRGFADGRGVRDASRERGCPATFVCRGVFGDGPCPCTT